jgi:DNA-binding HxlR family transcriptional regulator
MQVVRYAFRMLGRTYDAQVCSAARALELVGERWTLLIVRDALFAGASRYRDFQRSLGIASNVLSSRLDGLVEAGIMARHPGSDGGEPQEYRLTAKGRELVPVVLALSEWGDRYMAPDGPPILYQHTVCGDAARLAVICASCGEVHDPAEVRVQFGPGMPAERIARLS